eukprot:5064427-Amphidinium_carterae.1
MYAGVVPHLANSFGARRYEACPAWLCAPIACWHYRVPVGDDAGAASSRVPLADSLDAENGEVEVMVHRRAYQRMDERGEDARHSAPPFGLRLSRIATIADVRALLRKRLKLSPHRLVLKAFTSAAVLLPNAQ